MRSLIFQEASTVSAGTSQGMTAAASPAAHQTGSLGSYGVLRLVRELGDGAFPAVDEDGGAGEYEWVCPNVPLWTAQRQGRLVLRCLRAHVP